MADNAQSANSDGEIDIKVKTMQPATYELTVPVQITVAELKQRLVEKANIPQERQRIIYKGRVLDNDQRLEAHGVQQGHSLHLVERAPTAPAPGPAAAPAQIPGQAAGAHPIAFGSLELDATDENDVNGMLASIFQQLGGQGHVPGFMAGDGGNASEGDRQQRQGQEAQFITQQLMDSLGLGGGQVPGAGPGTQEARSILSSIAAYLRMLEDTAESPPMVLPSLSYQPAQGQELQQQTRLMTAVREVVRDYRAAFNESGRAYLDSEGAFQPPRSGSRQQGTADGAASTDANQAPASAPVSAPAANPAATQGEPIAATASDAAADTQTPSTAAAPPAAVPAAAPAAAVSQPDLPTQTQPQNSAATPQTEGSAAANQDQRGTGPVTEPTSSTSAQRRSAQRSARSGTEAPSGGRNALDGGRRQRRRGPTISPSVTMALGVLLHEMQQTTAFTDSFGVLNRSAAALERTYSYEGTHLQDVLTSLREAGSHLYRIAPVMMEMARAFSAAVAALQGDAGPLALSSSQYIRPDGSRPSIGHNPGNMQHSISMATIPLFAGMGTFGPNGPIPHGPAPGQPNAAGGPAAGAAANSPAPQATGAGGTASRPGNQSGIPPSAAGQPSSQQGSQQGAGSQQGIGSQQGPGQGHPMVMNIGQLLAQMGGGQQHQHMHGQHPLGAAMGEARQVIQVPGAPPVSIRWGARGAASQGPAAQAGQPPSPVTLQVGEGTPIDLTPVLQNLGTSLRSAVQSAFSSATSTPTPAAASTAAAAPASAGGPAAISPAASSASPATGQTATEAAQSRTAAPGSQTNTQSGSTPPSAQAAPLNFFLMQQVVRSLLMAVTPFIGTQAGAGLPAPRGEPSTGAAHPSPAASGGAPVAGHAGIRNMTPADLERLLTDSLNHERRSQQAAAAADSNPASSSGPAQPSNPASSRGPEQPSNAPAPPASAAPSGQVPSSSALEASHAAVTQASLPTQQGAEAASGSGSVLPASPSDPADSSTVPSATDPSATEPSATDPSAGGPSAGEASRSATSAGDSKGKRPALPSRAAGLGSGGLPPREKLDKTSRKGSAKSSTDKGEGAFNSRQASSSRPAPSQPLQDNVKRARVGDSPPQPSTSDPSGTEQHSIEEIARPAQHQASNQDGDQLSALFSSLAGNPSSGNSNASSLSAHPDASASGGLGGLLQMANQLMAEPGVSEAMSGMVEQIGRGSMARAGQRPGQAANSLAPDASQGLGGLMQGLAPMMQQLMSGGSGPNAGVAAGNRQIAAQGSPEQDLQSALKELDEWERAEWEKTIREDLVRQADIVPQRYKDHSPAYLAGNPPASNSVFAEGTGSSLEADELD